MNFRIEFPEGNSQYLPSLLRACSRFKTFKSTVFRKVKFYSVEIGDDQVESLQAVFELAKYVGGALYYCERKLITGRDLYQKIWNLRNKAMPNERFQKRHKFMQALLPTIIAQKKETNLN